jgi:hypothetical protein
MFSIRKINPMVRAVGTMGAVVALAGGITFALTTNTTTLASSTFTSGTPLLQVSNNGSTFADSANGPNDTLTPGKAQAYTFYLKNNDTNPLTITASVPTNVSGSTVPAADVTITLNCGSGDVTFPLSSWSGGSAAIPGTIAGSSTATCTQTVTLASTYSNAGDAVTPYDFNFVGNE